MESAASTTATVEAASASTSMGTTTATTSVSASATLREGRIRSKRQCHQCEKCKYEFNIGGTPHICPPPDDWEPGQLRYDPGDFTPNWIARTSLWLQLSNPCISDRYLPSLRLALRLLNRAKPPRNTPRLNLKHAAADLVARQMLRLGVFLSFMVQKGRP
jgi:hypothetical protein